MKVIKPIILVALLAIGAIDIRGQVKPVQTNAEDTLPIKSDSLQAALVTATMRPHMKGDTLEYNTEHILVRRNALVEELLRRLPGLRVDPDGTITYNGEKIQHLLVDGEDIFGADPTMVTRNFDASKIAKVQILDRKTDQAIFSGVDDGIRIKTLNLVMKESAKDGYFGKVEIGGNNGGYYNADGALAAFRDKEQFTVLGLTSNTGTIGFTSNLGNSTAGVSFVNDNSDPLRASAGRGIPIFAASALHYANTWSGGEVHLMTNYQFSHFLTRPVTTTETLQTEANTIYRQDLQSQSINQQDQHYIYGTFDWMPNTKSATRVNFYSSTTQAQNQLFSFGTGMFNDTIVNKNTRVVQDHLSRESWGGNISWRTEIGRKVERTISMNLGVKGNDVSTNGYLYSTDQFYEPNGSLQNLDTVDQRKRITGHLLSVNSSVNFTEPLWRGAMLGLTYEIAVLMDEPAQLTFARGDGKYEEVVDSLSNDLKMRSATQRATITLQGKFRKFSYTLGNDWIDYKYDQQDILTDSVLRLHYVTWAPKAIFNYTGNSANSFRLVYSSNFQQPSPAQLEAISNNSDPLHIIIGNPNLKPGFNQTFRVDYRHVKTWIIDVGLNLGFVNEGISTRTFTDSLGRQISQPVNVDGGTTMGFNLSVTKRIAGIDFGFYGNSNIIQNFNYINSSLNKNEICNTGGGVGVTKFVMDKISIELNTSFAYFNSKASINYSTPVHYWTENHQGSVSIFYLRGFELNTNAVYTWQQRTGAFGANTSVLLWNGYVSRNLLHDKLGARFQFNNILNANAGISRTNVANVNNQSSTNILGRYWMLSAIYHFDKKFKRSQDRASATR